MLRVLIIDDSLFMQRMLTDIFEDQSWIVYVASNSASGIKLYKKYNPDLVTIDITLPDEDGIKTTKKIKKINDKAKIICCSAIINQKPFLKNMIDAGIIDIVSKPFKKQDIINIINKHF